MPARPSPHEEPVVMRPRWWAPVTAAGCLVFAAMGAALVAAGDPPAIPIGILSIAFFGGGLVVLLLRRPWRWALVIDDRGVTRRRPGRDILVRWTTSPASAIGRAAAWARGSSS